RSPTAHRLDLPPKPNPRQTPEDHRYHGDIHGKTPRVLQGVRLIVATPTMHPIEEGRSAEFFPLNDDLVGRRVEGHPTRAESMLPVDNQWFAVSSAADRMGAVQAEILQDLLTDLFARCRRRKGSRVIQFAFGRQRWSPGRIKGKNEFTVSHDQ